MGDKKETAKEEKEKPKEPNNKPQERKKPKPSYGRSTKSTDLGESDK
jgi:hypothetical protein